jgi:divalent metal cation (Fe/Co/Zn/Cd) transporter
MAAGTLAGSIALLAFGIDSLVETASGVVVGWRLLDEIRNRSEDRAERVEKLTSRVADRRAGSKGRAFRFPAVHGA